MFPFLVIEFILLKVSNSENLFLENSVEYEYTLVKPEAFDHTELGNLSLIQFLN